MTIPGDNPLAYQGVNAPNPPNLVRANRPPAATDVNHDLGTFWLDESTSSVFVLVSIGAGAATWDPFGGGTAGVDTINSLLPTGGNIVIAQTANQVSVASAGSTVTLSLPMALIAPGSITAAGGDVIATRSDAGMDVTLEATNSDNTSLTSNAYVEVSTGGAASGDSGIRFQVSGVATNWSAGLDNSDSDAFVISASNTIGTNNAMRIDHTTQDIQFSANVDLLAGNLNVNGSITADSIVQNASSFTFSQSPLLQSNLNTGAAPTGATGDVNLMSLQNGEIMEQFILGAGQTIIAPRMTTTGLLTSLDLVAAEGAEYNWGMRSNALNTFTIGTSPAFFVELQVNAADVGGLDPLLAGFRIVQANNATLSNYTDFAAIGANATTAADVVIIQDQLNTGGVNITNTTDAWLDGQTRTFRVNVSAAGVVTYLINGAPPTVPAAFTFDNGDVVAPFLRHLFGAATPGAINWISLSVGLQ